MAETPRLQLHDALPMVYDELRELASRLMAGERKGHSFQTTELVHEAYLRLARLDRIDLSDKRHIMRIAVGVMRRVLIDHARKHNAQKRDPSQLFLQCPINQFENRTEAPPLIDLLALDEALIRLREIDQRKAEIIELRYFGGQDTDSVADLLGISAATVKRDWALAKAWMFRELNEESVQA